MSRVKYVAYFNMPGYLPDSDESPPIFDTPKEAWEYLLNDLSEDEAYEPADPNDPSGPWIRSSLALALERKVENLDGPWAVTGTVYGPVYAYTVDVAESEDE